jgi:hypothetical protein
VWNKFCLPNFTVADPVQPSFDIRRCDVMWSRIVTEYRVNEDFGVGTFSFKTESLYVNLALRRVRVTIVDVEKDKIFIFCVFVALVIQHKMRMRHIILPSLACLAGTCFATLSHKLHDFPGGGLWGESY